MLESAAEPQKESVLLQKKTAISDVAAPHRKKFKIERKISIRMSRIYSLVKAVVEDDGRKFI
jgi:hypothetical protein